MRIFLISGFLNARIGDKIEANFGIWDQVMALQWIQANIKQFGGDPNRVTLMGESAGGAACSLLALSPKTEGDYYAYTGHFIKSFLRIRRLPGLVQQAIIMSGSVTAGWAIHRHGTPSWSLENLVSYLRSVAFLNSLGISPFLNSSYYFWTFSFISSTLWRTSCSTMSNHFSPEPDLKRRDGVYHVDEQILF